MKVTFEATYILRLTSYEARILRNILGSQPAGSETSEMFHTLDEAIKMVNDD